jgi:4-amino-4-deoxychorismate lyase
MKKFIESLRIYNGEVSLIELHQRRFDLTRLAHFGHLPRIDLKSEIAAWLANAPATAAQGLVKMRIVYGIELEDISAEPYVRRNITSVALVESPQLDYRYKYADRSALEMLRSQVAAGVEPVIVQNGLITDAIYANVCLFDGHKWLTPAQPLLEGVARSAALAAGEIFSARISARDIEQGKYQKIRLINCMNFLKEANDISL